MNKPLAIATIFAPSERNAAWYSLQKRFLAKTTNVPFDYSVILNGVKPVGFDPGDVVLVNHENVGHGEALMQAVERFREDRHDAYLLLDSDCFPVTPGWHHILTDLMTCFGRVVAAPVRTENLDLFPHPCAFFLLDEALADPRLEFRKVTSSRNLLGFEVSDAGCAAQEMGDSLLPLLRTNVVNLHPVAAAIYHHLFYHHGAGSRDFEFRVLKRFGYYRHCYPNGGQQAVGERLFRALIRDPDRFIDRLMGRRQTALSRVAHLFLSRVRRS